MAKSAAMARSAPIMAVNMRGYLETDIKRLITSAGWKRQCAAAGRLEMALRYLRGRK